MIHSHLCSSDFFPFDFLLFRFQCGDGFFFFFIFIIIIYSSNT